MLNKQKIFYWIFLFSLAIDIAEKNNKLVTIGIKPTYPSTGYGYINYSETLLESVYEVEQFIEKPNLETAKLYVENPGYAWNSGMFVWKASTILESFERFLPKVYQYLDKIAASLGTTEEHDMIQKIYGHIPSISIDYGIMERSDNVAVVLGDFGWNDIGSWDSLGAIYDVDDSGNVIKGEQVNLNTKNCICYAENRLIATIGIENLIVVETEDAVLVCRKDQAQKVKDIVGELRERGLEQYLV
jgi:mannose-1-phosphate guanylyltransferase